MPAAARSRLCSRISAWAGKKKDVNINSRNYFYFIIVMFLQIVIRFQVTNNTHS